MTKREGERDVQTLQDNLQAIKDEKEAQEAVLNRQIVDLQNQFDMEKASIYFEKSEITQKYEDEAA